MKQFVPIFQQSEHEGPKLGPREVQVVGFIPGYHKFDAATCMRLNAELAVRLQKHKPFSPEWFSLAKDFHNNAQGWLRCCS